MSQLSGPEQGIWFKIVKEANYTRDEIQRAIRFNNLGELDEFVSKNATLDDVRSETARHFSSQKMILAVTEALLSVRDDRDLRKWLDNQRTDLLATESDKSPINAEVSVHIVFVRVDERLANKLADAIRELSYPVTLNSPQDLGTGSIREKDFLVVLLSPHANVDSRLRFLLGIESVRRHESPEDRIDAIVLCGGVERAHVTDLEPHFSIYDDSPKGFDDLFRRLCDWKTKSCAAPPANQSGTDTLLAEWNKLIDRFLFDATRLLSQLSVNLPNIHRTHEVATHFIYYTATKFSEGVVRVVEPRRVYEHDMKTLDLLRKDEHLFATHPVSQILHVPRPASVQDATGQAYAGYIRAQVNAINRGVQISRIYMVPTVENGYRQSLKQAICSETMKELRKEMKSLGEAGIEIRILADDSDVIRIDLQRDFVVFSNRCLGLGYEFHGPMVWSDYLIAQSDRARTTIRDYTQYFENLREVATPLDNLLEL